MLTVGSYEAKTHLPQLLEKVANGEHVTITKHGVPIARIVPMDKREINDIDAVIDQIKEFQKEHRLDGLSVREMIDEGRKR